ncbi:MAG: hypothetical protein JW731_16805 [Bacteroidales bacterium]|nr:hypothetical protein [Bacteroidales bacterium]
MKDINRTHRLTRAIIVFILIIVVGFITLKPPKFEYGLSENEMLKELQNPDNTVLPEQMKQMLSSGGKQYLLVDLRNPYDFSRGHLENAINIPVSEILSEDGFSFFEESEKNSVNVILYGKNQLEANGPWMFLRQLGFNNVQVLAGGYDFFHQLEPGKADYIHKPNYIVEEPVMNFSEFIDQSTSENIKSVTEQVKPENVIPIKREKKSGTAGGC